MKLECTSREFFFIVNEKEVERVLDITLYHFIFSPAQQLVEIHVVSCHDPRGSTLSGSFGDTLV